MIDLTKDRLLTRREVMDFTGMGVWKVIDLERSGRLRPIRLGVRTIRYLASEVERLMKGESATGAREAV